VRQIDLNSLTDLMCEEISKLLGYFNPPPAPGRARRRSARCPVCKEKFKLHSGRGRPALFCASSRTRRSRPSRYPVAAFVCINKFEPLSKSSDVARPDIGKVVPPTPSLKPFHFRPWHLCRLAKLL
jgi:hypothetical protein